MIRIVKIFNRFIRKIEHPIFVISLFSLGFPVFVLCGSRWLARKLNRKSAPIWGHKLVESPSFQTDRLGQRWAGWGICFDGVQSPQTVLGRRRQFHHIGPTYQAGRQVKCQPLTGCRPPKKTSINSNLSGHKAGRSREWSLRCRPDTLEELEDFKWLTAQRILSTWRYSITNWLRKGKRKRPDLNLIDRRIGFAVSAVAIDLPNKLHQL